MRSDLPTNDSNQDVERTKVLGAKDRSQMHLNDADSRKKKPRLDRDSEEYFSAALLDALNEPETSDSIFEQTKSRSAVDYSFAEDENEKTIAAKVNSLMSGEDPAAFIKDEKEEKKKDINVTANLAEDFESTMYRPGQGDSDHVARTKKISRYERQKQIRKNRRILISCIITGVILIGLIVFFAVRCSRNEAEEVPAETETEESTEAELTDVITTSIEDGGEYISPLRIEVTSEEGNKIYYTTDGSEVTDESAKYAGGIDIEDEGTYTINIATFTTTSVKKGEFSAVITVVFAGVHDPEISPESGDYDTYQDITVSGDDGVVIYYTYDGSTPDEYSDRYYDPVEMKRGSYVFSAVAVSSDGVWSNVATRSYNLNIPSNYTNEEALDIVMNKLLLSGKIINESGDTDEDGGYAEAEFKENYTIGNVVYMVFTVNFKDEEGEIQSTEYYGVNDQIGAVVEMTPTEDGYGLS